MDKTVMGKKVMGKTVIGQTVRESESVTLASMCAMISWRWIPKKRRFRMETAST
jgi:hypothetical protein